MYTWQVILYFQRIHKFSALIWAYCSCFPIASIGGFKSNPQLKTAGAGGLSRKLPHPPGKVG